MKLAEALPTAHAKSSLTKPNPGEPKLVNFTIDAPVVLNSIHLAVNGSDVPLAQVERFIDRAIVTIENYLDVTIGEMSGNEGEKTIDVDKKYEAVIVVLAAIHCICYLSGGSAVGFNFSLGDISVSQMSKAPPLDVLHAQLTEALEALKKKVGEIAFIVGQDTSGLR